MDSGKTIEDLSRTKTKKNIEEVFYAIILSFGPSGISCLKTAVPFSCLESAAWKHQIPLGAKLKLIA